MSERVPLIRSWCVSDTETNSNAEITKKSSSQNWPRKNSQASYLSSNEFTVCNTDVSMVTLDDNESVDSTMITSQEERRSSIEHLKEVLLEVINDN